MEVDGWIRGVVRKVLLLYLWETHSERERLERVLEGSTTDCPPVSMIGRDKRGVTDALLYRGLIRARVSSASNAHDHVRVRCRPRLLGLRTPKCTLLLNRVSLRDREALA